MLFWFSFFLSFSLTLVWKQGKNNQITCMTLHVSGKCSLKAQAATQKQRVGSICTSCYAKAVNSASCCCCNKQSCSQVLNTVTLHAVHTPTQTTFIFFTQLLTSAVFVYDTGMPRKQSYGKLYCRVWFWPPGCKSNIVPGQARSAALRGSEVVTEEGMKARCRFLSNLPLLSLRTGGWGGCTREVTYFWLCFQFATICPRYFCFGMLRYELNFTMFCSLIPGLN